ncbi:hypothetical protein [Microbacterium sp. G2-8]|uniref:hypothetical protein n=1 Tax=Microbacterium sp. G2-8 TaxID=2842454 RepID=UPI001C8B09CE|nr:hypothetical protein [Microbacterium sp. G2-8]
MTWQRTKTAVGILSGTILVGALAGCATGTTSGDAPDPEVTLTAGPAPATDSPMPPAEPSDPPDDDETADPSMWEVDDGEVGPIEVGDDFRDTLAELGDDWQNDEQCAYMAWWNAPDGSYLVSFHHDDAADETGIIEVSVELTGDAADGPRTEHGVGLGSTRDEVMAAYPDAMDVPATIGGGSYLKVADDDVDDGALFFEFAEGADTVGAMAVSAADEPAYEACA